MTSNCNVFRASCTAPDFSPASVTGLPLSSNFSTKSYKLNSRSIYVSSVPTMGSDHWALYGSMAPQPFQILSLLYLKVLCLISTLEVLDVGKSPFTWKSPYPPKPRLHVVQRYSHLCLVILIQSPTNWIAGTFVSPLCPQWVPTIEPCMVVGHPNHSRFSASFTWRYSAWCLQ